MKPLYTLIIFISFSICVNAQVLIDADGSATLESSAILDVQSTEKGFLPPRLSWPEMQAIENPAEGLMIYNTTANCMYVYNGTKWFVIEYCDCGSVTDYEGNYYETVLIGDQCWMAENLKSTKYADGTDISSVGSLHDNGDYGNVYNWAAIMNGSGSSSTNPSGVQGVCPTGWHVPSSSEWTELETTLGAINAGRKLKKYDNLWTQNSTHANAGYNDDNASGFNAIPGGYFSGSFGNQNNQAYFWTATEVDATHAENYRLAYDAATLISETTASKNTEFSVRCVRD